MQRNFIFFTLSLLGILLALASARSYSAAGSSSAALNQPVYTPDGKLVLPANYRDWVFLTSGFGMNYSNGAGRNPMFTNVYVAPEAYQGFKATGKWPDKSMFIVEIYSPAGHGSINKGGHYQDSFMGLDVEVKDASRPSEWSYYNFAPGVAQAEPEGSGCNKCHDQHAAVEHTFVQFYPTLLDFAVEKKLIKPGVSVPLNQSRFMKILSTSGWEKAEKAYSEDKKKNPESDLLSEHVLNLMGYGLLRDAKITEAIAVFKLVTRDYPNSANAYDSLADAYVQAKQPQQAIAASEKELALAPSDPGLTAEQKKQAADMAQKRIAGLKKQ